MRKEVAELVHQVDAQFIVVDADMHVHAADQKTSGRCLHFGVQRSVPGPFRMLLLFPVGERVRGCRNGRKSVGVGYVRDGRAQFGESHPGLGHVAADARAHLDLCPQQFRADELVAAALGAIFQHVRGHGGDQVPGLAVHEQVFLLDAK